MRTICTVALILATATLHPSRAESGPNPGEKPVNSIPGYSYGRPDLERSPVSPEDLQLLEASVLFTDDDRRWLQESLPILEPQVERILDTWYGFVGSQPHLLAYFSHPGTGEPQSEYLDAVRKRFGQWILDTARAEYDQEWLDYQHEIGKRHHRTGKNQTDGADAAAHIPARYVLALVYPITATLRPYLEESGRPAADVDAMHEAWRKSVLMQAILWMEPYVPAKDF